MSDSLAMRRHAVCAIIVTFHPEPGSLLRLITSLIWQVDCVVVVDNGSASGVLGEIPVADGGADIELIANGVNLGIAAAHNRGIQRARDKGCSHVVLFDQDSQPSSYAIAQLLGALDELSRQGNTQAVVGPCIWDERLGVAKPFVQIGALSVTRISCHAGADDLVRSDFLISSGMMIPLRVFDIVGLMDESLFIDNVDLEWCFRARKKGISLFGARGVRMAHALGDRAFRLGRFVIHHHSPLRQYYMMRNRILLYRRACSPRAWVFQDFLRMLVKIVLFTLVFSPRRENAAMMLRGVWDGMLGVTGKYR